MSNARNAESEVGPDGFGRGRDCPTCHEPLQPGHMDETTTVVWLCPLHGLIDITIDPFADPLV